MRAWHTSTLRMLCFAQAEDRFNRVLDLCAKSRDDMAGVSDNISLGTAFHTLWEDLDEEATPWCACQALCISVLHLVC